MREIGSGECLRNVVQTGKRNLLRSIAERPYRLFHGGKAKQGVQSFANGGQDHEVRSEFAVEAGERSRIL